MILKQYISYEFLKKVTAQMHSAYIIHINININIPYDLICSNSYVYIYSRRNTPLEGKNQRFISIGS